MQSSNIFEHFKRQNAQVKTRLDRVEEIYFQIQFDDFGAYIQTVDAKGKAVEVSYLNYSGSVRQVLRVLEQIQDRNSFVIDWEKPQDQIYLAEHDYLLEPLRNCSNVIDWKKNLLQFSKREAQLKLSLKHQHKENNSNTLIESQVILEYDGQPFENFHLITENHLLVGEEIVEISTQWLNFY
ncbi:MAG: hypothetical protein AAFO82_07100, partial [Bacteroidota bacterium]